MVITILGSWRTADIFNQSYQLCKIIHVFIEEGKTEHQHRCCATVGQFSTCLRPWLQIISQQVVAVAAQAGSARAPVLSLHKCAGNSLTTDCCPDQRAPFLIRAGRRCCWAPDSPQELKWLKRGGKSSRMWESFSQTCLYWAFCLSWAACLTWLMEAWEVINKGSGLFWEIIHPACKHLPPHSSWIYLLHISRATPELSLPFISCFSHEENRQLAQL